MAKSAANPALDRAREAAEAVENRNPPHPGSTTVSHASEEAAQPQHVAARPKVAAPAQPVAAYQPAPLRPMSLKRSINIMRFKLRYAGELHNVWDASIERGHTFNDLLDSDYWKHVAVNIRREDEIIAIEETGAFRAHLFVNGADRLWAKTFPLSFHDLTASYAGMPLTQAEEYDVNWTAIGKFAIHKKGNQGLPALKDGFQSRLDALQWLDGHLKTINANV